jgi:tetratricopeptide (TPR) repeat protein
MLRGVFRTKELKIIAAILGLFVITIGIIVFTSYSENRQFVEQAVMAENYLKSGSYEQAIEAYLKALSMKGSDQQLLTIGLADAYVGNNDYDKALSVLRSCYQKTSGIKIKEKIEEVTSEKTDYEYLQSISRAEVYFSNKEFDKAISEFEKAKLIKSKDVTAYRRIAEAYIEMGEYELALEEVLEGQVLTQEESLEETLALVNTYLRREEYDELVAQAAEYIYQENYIDGEAKYKEAIELLPFESVAYNELAKNYLSQEEYEKAYNLLEEASIIIENEELTYLLNQASELLEKEKERYAVLSQLYTALEQRDVDTIIAVMGLTLFQDDLMKEIPIYYGIGEGDTSKGVGMIIYDSKHIYYGDINNGSKKGVGIYFMLTQSNPETGYYYYDGKWDKDIPNGPGKTVEVIGNSQTVTEGNYNNALENGRMTRSFYIDGEMIEKVLYSVINGKPVPMASENSQPLPTPGVDSYVIGILNSGDDMTGENYRVEPNTIWGVDPFIKSE